MDPMLLCCFRRFQLWDAYGVLPTVCGIRDKTGACTYAGIEAETPANCIMPLEAVINRLDALKVGDNAGREGVIGERGLEAVINRLDALKVGDSAGGGSQERGGWRPSSKLFTPALCEWSFHPFIRQRGRRATCTGSHLARNRHFILSL